MTSTSTSGQSRTMAADEAIRVRLAARGWNQAKLSEVSGVNEVVISRIMTGFTGEPELDTIVKIAHAFGETVGAFLGEKGFDLDAADQQYLRDHSRWIQAKLGAATQPLVDSAPNAVELQVISDRNPSASPDAAAIPGLLKLKGANRVFRAHGDSMSGAGILDNQLLFVRPYDVKVARMAAGKIVVCTVRNKTYVKKMEMAHRRVRLLSANERYAPIEIARADIEFIGVVIGHMAILVS